MKHFKKIAMIGAACAVAMPASAGFTVESVKNDKGDIVAWKVTCDGLQTKEYDSLPTQAVANRYCDQFQENVGSGNGHDNVVDQSITAGPNIRKSTRAAPARPMQRPQR
ncbi:hypothetical protein KUV46_00590 [Thalassovita mediterranea]|nr:hypothetical protein KUV46_00590 [Thalassovita mediterranea]